METIFRYVNTDKYLKICGDIYYQPSNYYLHENGEVGRMIRCNVKHTKPFFERYILVNKNNEKIRKGIRDTISKIREDLGI